MSKKSPKSQGCGRGKAKMSETVSKKHANQLCCMILEDLVCCA